jgi:hypothetical protein
MTGLSTAALGKIRAAGFTRDQWIRMWGFGESGKWGGDRCGCFDDRCANGFHHMGADDCGCVAQLIDDAVAWRRATRNPSAVELVGGPWGLNQWVDVATPHVIATVSTAQHYLGPTVNGVPHERPAETSIRIAPQEGWTAVVGEEDTPWNAGKKQMVIRFVKTPTATDETTPKDDSGGN